MTPVAKPLVPCVCCVLMAATVGVSPAWARPRPHPRSGVVGPGRKPKWPKSLRTRQLLLVTLRYERGRLFQKRLKLKTLRKPRQFKRYVGRFLAKLYARKKLRDVVPFNIPLLAPAENYTRTGHRIARKLEANIRTGTRLQLPWLPSIDRIEITDAATGRRWALDLRPVRRRRARPRATRTRR